MRIAQIMAGAPQGGAELFYERLCAALHASGETVLPVIRRDPARAARLVAAGLSPVQRAFSGRLDVATPVLLRRILRDFAPKVAVSWMSRATSMMPRGDWVHVGRLGGYYDLGYYRRCDHLAGNTRGIVEWLRGQGWPAARTHYLPNFAEDFAGVAPAALDLPRPLLLGLGRLHRDKGFDLAIRALRRVPRATLAIAGEGPERAALLRLAAGEGVADRVRLLGWRTDRGALLAAADMLVCSSRVEPLGNIVIEAWSAAIPVVAAAAAGPAELIEHGVTGHLVANEDAAGLADGISRVLADRPYARRLAAGGRAAFAASFAERVVVAQWRAWLASLA